MKGRFDLSVSFSQYNGAVVLESAEDFVKIGLTNMDDEKIKQKLSNSVRAYFGMRGKIFSDRERCLFVPIDSQRLKQEISLRYGESSRENERKNEGSEAAMLLDTLLSEAGKSGASDIHIEEKRVRFRISGRLREICELSAEKSRELVRRIKILANLNVLESRRGQDGKFVFHGENDIFVRVSCLPSVSAGGEGSCESIVLRLLDVNRVPLALEELGFSDSQCSLLRNVCQKEQGLILICGATGSGKSTTAASLLMELNERSDCKKKIITIEDPPEYVLDGITQIHVDEANGMSFSDSLRFIFRQDPDVIFVGEIRDALTARTVLQASLTGHLVFATVHTAGMQETAIRMKELGVDFSEFASVLHACVFQKLTVTSEDSIRLEANIVTRDENPVTGRRIA